MSILFKNNYLHFILLVLVTFLFTYEFNSFIQTDEIYVQNFSDKYTQEAIRHILDWRHTWSWVGYIFLPAIMYISGTTIALIIFFVIWISYLNEKDPNVRFSDTWRIVLFAQWSNVAAMFAKIFWFGFIQTNYTMNDLTSFYQTKWLNYIGVLAIVWFYRRMRNS